MTAQFKLKPKIKRINNHFYLELNIHFVKLEIEQVDEFPATMYVIDVPILKSPIVLSVSIFGLLLFKIGMDHKSQMPERR